jgi:hypothetical protein
LLALISAAQKAIAQINHPSFTTNVGVEAHMNSTVSLLVEVPEVLHESLRMYLEMRPDWDQDRVFTAALSLFLLQNRGADSSP